MKTFEEWLQKNEKYIVEKDCFAWLEQCWIQATEAAKPRWIPVTERLPDKDIKCVLRLTVGKNQTIEYIGNYIVGRGFSKTRQLTHWMEIPE